MIQIYDVNNTSYDKNGDIVLTPISATIHPILNGAWEAELTHPIDKEGRWKHIVEEAVVKMPGFYEHWKDQLFRIKSVEKQDSGVTATMEPIFYDAMGDCFLTDVRAVQENGQQALTTMLSPNAKYSASSNITKVNTAYYNYVNFLEALNGSIDQSFIKRWGGEILYNNFQVVVNTQVGGDYGVELRYGKNIPKDGMQFTADVRDIVTRLYPKAYNGRKLSGNGYVDSPLINNYPIVMTATLTFENIKLRQDMEDSENVEENVIICENQEELDKVLTEQCQAQFEAGIDKPKITISVDMVLLQNTEQYKDIKQLEAVSLGDIVHCRNTHLGITNDARVIELEYDCIRRKVTSVVLGDYEYDYFDDVSSTTQIVQGIINPDGSVMAERVQGILNGIYTQLRLQSTAAQKVDGVAFKVEDLDTTSPLYGCMIWGTQGIQISTKRTADGRDWDWTTAITAQGIVANAIVTGLLSDKTGNNYWDLDTGEFRLSSTGFEVDGETLEQYINDSLTQQQIFNKLTNNGQLQGIYMQDGLLYINGTYIKAGIITDNVGKNYWNLNTGEFRLSANSTVGGQPIATQNNTIKSVDVEYASGTSNTTPPTSGWATTAPDWQEGRYIWQRTVTTMQDGTQNISDPTCIQGAAGENGEAGATGIGVSQIIEQYYLSTSSTTQTGGSWSTAQPAWEKGKYIWTRSQITWTDDSVTHTDPVLAKAINGANEAVDDLDTSLDQQEVFNRLTNNGKTQGIYLQDGLLYINGTYIKTGILTDNVGKNYWNLNTGEFRLSATSTVGGEEIATKNDTITNVDVEYSLGDSSTTAPTTGWSTDSPEWEQGKYIWQRTVTTMQDGTKNTSEPTCIQGAAGQSGESVTIESNATTYAVSDSGTETPEQWQSTIPATQPGQYLWSKTETKYSDGSTSTSYGVTYQGINGTDGTDGNGIVSSSVQYQIGDSSDTPPTGRWTDSIPDMQPGDYLWTRTQFTYSDGDVTTTYSVSYLGENGSQGIQGPPGENGQTLYTWIKYADSPTSGMSDLPDGKAYLGIAYNKESPIESTNYEDYQWSDIKGEDGLPGAPGENGETLYTWIKYATDASGSNMSDSPAGCSYIGIAYNKNTPEESSNPTDYAWSLIQGEAGIGVKNVVDEYYLSNSESEPSGGFWTTTQPEWKLGFYIWTRSAVTYTSGETEYTDPILAQAINSANQAVSDLDNSLNQEGVFNRLTNNGQTQGIYLQDGILYINASYIASGTVKGNLIDARNLIVKDSAGNTTFAVDANGNVSIRCTSFSLNGSTISSIANSAASNALTNAKDYTDEQLEGFTPILTQEEVFNALTNNGQMQGIYMENGYLYINASYIDTGNLAGWIIDRANRKIYCTARTTMGTTTITFDAGNGEITVVNNSTGISTTIDHYGVESTSIRGDTVWAKALNIGNNGSSAVITDKTATFFVPIYADDISTSGTVALNGTTRIGGTLNIPGAMNTNGKVSFGADGQGEGMFNVHDIAYFYNDIYYANAPQTGGGNYVRIGSSGRIFRQGSSSIRYKNHVRYMNAEEAENLYNIPVIFFKYKDGYLTKDDPKANEALPGFYAEDIAEYVPAAADYKDIDGQRLPENWDSRYLIPYMVKCIQEQHKEIEQLKETNNKILQALASAGIEVRADA